jgi:hypothetical protein
MQKVAFYMMVKLQFGNQPAYWYPAWEAETLDDAEDALVNMDKRYGEIERKVIRDVASGDCRECRPC